MYCYLAIVEDKYRMQLIMVPYETKQPFSIKNCENVMELEANLYVYSAPVSIYIADWLLNHKTLFIKDNHKNVVQMQQIVHKLILNISGAEKKYSWSKYRLHNTNHKDITLSSTLSNSSLKLVDEANMIMQLIKGRKLLYDEFLQLAAIHLCDTDRLRAVFQRLIMNGHIQLRSAIEVVKVKKIGQRMVLRCLRCYGTSITKAQRWCEYCGPECYYCEACIQMGRARTCSLMVMGNYLPISLQQKSWSKVDDAHPNQLLVLDDFGLSDAQQNATTEALSFVYQRFKHQQAAIKNNKIKSKMKTYANQFLLWAVTGAGKTEMIFPLIAYMIKLGGRVLLATPRRDVVLELAPRLQKAFPHISIVTLYGGSDEKWNDGQLFIATTHQLMRFHRAFDLVIIDELDAFPYHGDEKLYRVAEQCNTETGVRILLSATPPLYLQRQIKKGMLAHVKLPVRYHRHPLPVPRRLHMPSITHQLLKRQIPSLLIQTIQSSIDHDAQIFIFLQRIKYTEAYASLLRGYFPCVRIEATSSQDSNRSEKVAAFRNRDIRILITTTILERGVTIPKSHVYICDAEAALFDEASLVQMAGRAGRSKDEPVGAVYFLSVQWNQSQQRAIKQIKEMNQLAAKHGYLLEP